MQPRYGTYGPRLQSTELRGVNNPHTHGRASLSNPSYHRSKAGSALIENLVVLASLIVAAAVFLSPRLTASPVWRATVTPLASIIGSGFLVSLPLFAGALGDYAFWGMAGLVVAAYLIGGAIRFNIIHGEPLFGERAHPALKSLESISHLALALAYFISVTYYLTLFGAFLLKGFGAPDAVTGKILTSSVLFAIGVQGLVRGLHGLETIEEYAVGIKLAAIAAVLAALVWLNMRLAASGSWHLPSLDAQLDWHSMRTVLGLLIVVQGFETSRFLKGAYPAELRVRTMRYAQTFSGGIYFAFFLLATVTLQGTAFKGDVAAVTDILRVAASSLPLVLIGGAIFAQLSAAIADSIGAGGLIEQLSRNVIDHRHAYPVVALVGICLTWSLDVFGVIALASRAFALFYMLQCMVAAGVALVAPKVTHRFLRATSFLALAGFALAVVLLGIPATGI